ncbi:MAG: MaoC/PaaZ C-terminal domain-containing protein [Dehalococcoidia bacterium]|nr:MaoC/PaaZ C-terminal domain-containing protein [Dehalococcoidia bacterium]
MQVKLTPPYWEEFEIGQVFETPRRTVTEADLMFFSAWSWDHHPLHTDGEFAKQSMFGERILHGQAGYVIASGLAMQTGLHRETALALLGVKWDYKGAIKIGDTLTVTEEVVEKRETRRPDRAIVVMHVRLINQRGEVVQEGPWTFLYARKPVAD